MADEQQVIRGINWRETLPFTHIFRAFRVAVHPSKLMLGLIALLSLYIGGHVLDGIWPAASLAVPGEVYDYQRHVVKGTSNQEFARERLEAREKVESEYARKLLDLGVTADEKAAQAAADEVRELKKVEEKILAIRKEAIARADARLKDDLAAAGVQPDDKPKERAKRAANDAYNASLRAAYHEAYESLRSAKKIEGEGLFARAMQHENDHLTGKLMIDFVGPLKKRQIKKKLEKYAESDGHVHGEHCDHDHDDAHDHHA